MLNKYNPRVSVLTNLSPLGQRKLSHSPSDIAKKYVRAKKQLENLVQERKELQDNCEVRFREKSKSQLIAYKLQMESRIKVLEDENRILRRNQNEVWKQSEMDEVLKLKKMMRDLQVEREEQLKILQLIKDKEFYEKCVRDHEYFEKTIINRKINQIKKLQKHSEILEKKIKSNQIKFAQELKDILEQKEKIERDTVILQMKVLKMKQKDRLLDISQKSLTPTERQSYSKVGFLYKPSINQLYT